jgi:hypothetical protein
MLKFAVSPFPPGKGGRGSFSSAAGTTLREEGTYPGECFGFGSVCFLASQIRNFFVRIRILPSTSKKMKKTPLFLPFSDFFMNLSLKNDVNVGYLQKGKSIKREKKLLFLMSFFEGY